MEQLLGQRRRSRDLPGADQDRGASATNDAHVTEVESPHVHEILQTTDNDSDDHVIETILFQNHLGKTYIWPLRLCQSLEVSIFDLQSAMPSNYIQAVKSLILEAYAHDTWHSQQIINEQYDIENEDGAIILPSVWKTFLKPSAKVRISFRKELVSQQMPLSTQASGRSEVLISDAGDQDDTQNVELEAQTTSILDHAQISRAATSTSSDRDRDWVRYRSETRRVVPDPNLASSESDGEDDSTSSEHNGNVFSTDEEDLEPPRTVVPAVDDKGNRLSFGIDTSRARQRPYVQREVATKEEDSATSKHGHEIKEQSFKELRITKAMLGGTDTKTIMQVHILPGPDNPQLRGNVKTTWYHLQATQLDLTRFKETCIGIEGLTSRLQMLTREVFGRVEKRRVKKALYGYSVEPGTVVRADERRQDKPEAVIFSCIPYLDLQSLEKQAPVSSGTTPLLFPPRTLMQAMYPLWSVQDRDREQAYRKFGNEHNNKAVHLSDMWMVNIGADMVVTHGHRALADEMVNSIEVVKEDLRQLGSNDITRTSLTTVRITHRDSRVRLYTLDACRSYFQLESKLNRMKTVSCNSKIGDDLRVLYSFVEGRRVVAPNDWTAIVKRTDLMFIDLEEIEQDETSSTGNDLKLDASNAIGNSVPPFFRWPSTTSATNISNQGNPKNNPTADMEREAQRLEYAERIMLNEYLDSLFAYNDVEKSFTSTKYYRYLPETTHEHFVTRLESLLFEPERGTHLSFHATVIAEQRTCVATKSKSFYNIVQDTLRLFVSDLDGSATLRKLWCTMSNISDWVDQVLKLDGAAPGLAGGLAVNANDRCASTMGWYIRNDKLRSMALPNADKVFIRLLRHCRQCTNSRPFESAKSAIDHLETHWRPQMPGTHNNDCPPSDPNIPPSKDGGGLKLSDWIVEAKHLEQEKINAGGVKILTQSCEDASKLFQQIKELAEGIRNEDKEPSQLYTFPRQLVGAFHKLVVFYIGVERALWYTKASDQDIEDPRLLRGFPRQSVSMDILRTLKRFAKGVETSVSLARNQLCDMVKPDSTPDAMQNMSLGSEYVCAWFMRRLLVKPLESGLSTGDMYRKYLTNIVSSRL
jgi:hypothetical protein